MGSKSEHKQPVSTVTVDLQLKSGQKTLANAASIGAGNTAGAAAAGPPVANAAAAHVGSTGEMNANSFPAAPLPPPPPATKTARSPHPNNALLSNTTSKPAFPGAKHDVRGFCIRHPRCRMVRPLSGEEGGSDPNNYRTVRKICPSCGEQSLVKKERKQPSHGFNPYAARERDNGEKIDKTSARVGGDGKNFIKIVPKTKSQAAKSPHFRKRLHHANSMGGEGAAVDKNEESEKIKSQNETQNETERHKPTEGVRINSPSRSNLNNSGNHRINFKIDPPKDGLKKELSRQKSHSAIRLDEHNKDGTDKHEKKEGMQRRKSQNLQQNKPERREELQRRKSQSALRQEEEHGLTQDVKEEQKQKGQSAVRPEEEQDMMDEVQGQKSQAASQESRDEMRRQKSQNACRQDTRGEDHGDKVVRQDRRDELHRQKSQCAVRQQEEVQRDGGARHDKKDEAQRQKEKGVTKQEKQHRISRQKSQNATRQEGKEDDEQKEGGASDGIRDELKRQKSRDALLQEEKIDGENKRRSKSEPIRKGKNSSKHAQHNTVSSNSQGDDLETESIPLKSSTDSKEKTPSKVNENKESKMSSKGVTSPSDDFKRSSKEHNRKPLKLPVEKSLPVTNSVKSNSYVLKKKVPGKHDGSIKREVNSEVFERISEKKDKHTVKIATESLDSKIAEGRSRSLSPPPQMSRKATIAGSKEEVDEHDNRLSLKQRSKSVGHQFSRSHRQRIGSEFHYVHRSSVNPTPVAAISTYRMEFYDEIEARSCVKSLANM
ncbi:hypothetical protein ACHAW6_002714 [Cyclotella cf. meneghiniana]